MDISGLDEVPVDSPNCIVSVSEYSKENEIEQRKKEDKIKSQSSNFSTTTELFCRICYDVDKDEDLLSPCNCAGTVSFVHRTCLEFWLAASDSSHCEMCGYKYKTCRKARYSMLISILIWLENSPSERKILIRDLITALVIAPLAALSKYIGLLIMEIVPLQLPSPSVAEMAVRLALRDLLSLMISLDIFYATWATLRVQYHVRKWYFWYRQSHEVTLLLPDNC